MFERVLIPLDLNEPFSEINSRCNFISQLGAKYIYLLHVSSGNGDTLRSKQKLDDTALMLNHLGFNVNWEVHEGQTATAICQTAEDKQTVIYMPGRRKNILSAVLLGSTSTDVLRLAAVPVLVHKVRPALGDKIENVLYATDFEGAAQRALPYVKALASANAKATVLHVRHRAADPLSEGHRHQEAMNKIELIKKELQQNFAAVEGEDDVGTPSKCIAKYSEHNNTDIIVLGRYNKGLSQNIMGSTAERVSGKVQSSIMLIP